jgi:indolepyruvate ferredoxin oxidoreductase alpha subunit
MTGHQPHPGNDFDGMGRPAKMIKVEDVVKGCGIEQINVTNPNNIKKTTEAFKQAIEFKGPAVVVSKAPCILLKNRARLKSGKKITLFTIDQKKCKQCKICIEQFGCPSFYYGENDTIHIDYQQCNGCGNCVQICPSNAITMNKE